MMISKKNRDGFTLIEMLIVAAMIAVLVTIGALSYSGIRKKSNDSRRQTDLESVRLAIEQYRSNNNVYPQTLGDNGLPFGEGELTDGSGNIYLQSIPQDQLFPKQTYYYASSGADFTLGAELDSPKSTPCQSPPGGDSCGSGLGCNYCLGAYGEK